MTVYEIVQTLHKIEMIESVEMERSELKQERERERVVVALE